MVSPKDKNVKEAVPRNVTNYKGFELSGLPKFLSFRAAISHNEIVLKNVLVAILLLWGIQFSVDSFNDMEMAREFRKKEYLLAPSEITGITPVKPKIIPASYVDDISSIYLSLLGNVNALNIDNNYAQLQKHMSDSLRIKFNAETTDWIDTVKSENISEVLKIQKKKYSDGSEGFYRVTAIASRERYTGNKYVGIVREKIELILKIVPPNEDRRWLLQLHRLSRGSI